MDATAIARIKRYLQLTLRHDAYECGAIMFNMRQLARMSGHDLNAHFARAGLGAGPEARLAAEIVDRALGGGGGSASSEHQLRIATDRWIRKTSPMGMSAL